MKYAVILEQAASNWSAYVPDFPGCIAVGDTAEEVEQSIKEAIVLHIELMRESGEIIPVPTSRAVVLDIAA